MVYKLLKLSPVTEKNIFEPKVKSIVLILVVKKWSITNFTMYFRYKALRRAGLRIGFLQEGEFGANFNCRWRIDHVQKEGISL